LSLGFLTGFLAANFHRHPSAGIGWGGLGGDARGNRLQFRPHLLDRAPALHLGDACEIKLPRGFSFSSICSGIHKSDASGKRQPFGITPTTVTRLPFIVATRPMMLASDPK